MDEKKNENEIQEDIELSTDEISEPIEEAEIEETEENTNGKIKKLREKLKVCEQQKMEHLEELQRTKADYLNSKRRLEEERVRDKERAVNQQIEKLLPLCDSFHMAMHNKEAWDAIDPVWRKGVEGIHNQLQNILESYGVTQLTPEGEDFDPQKHEAMSNVPTETQDNHGKVMQVIQNGFVRTVNGTEELLRPARVTVGEYEEK